MIDQRLARDILALLDAFPVVKLDDIIWSQCTVSFYLPSMGKYWRVQVYAVKSYPDDTKLRLCIAREWGTSFRRVAYVDYETLQSLV